ncbi:hypothetical protein PanWU01x14_185620 [Parasponia andersonii]|uniref:Uncharacterized protein n=1 Tax=Parasponia andersonii TaxID=3476 RepID=A0A2P5C3W1_PARAD|nr:hypothetical protein PanWU01x14_185620 [Parasponia andersonii]
MGTLGLLTPPTVEVRVAVSRQQTHGASDRQLSWLGSDWLDRLGSVMGTLGLLTPPTVEVRVAVPRQQTHRASDYQLSWLGSDRLNRLGSVMGSALNSEDPKADGEITCDPRGPDLLQGSGTGPTTAPISLFDRFMSIK